MLRVGIIEDYFTGLTNHEYVRKVLIDLREDALCDLVVYCRERDSISYKVQTWCKKLNINCITIEGHHFYTINRRIMENVDIIHDFSHPKCHDQYHPVKIAENMGMPVVLHHDILQKQTTTTR